MGANDQEAGRERPEEESVPERMAVDPALAPEPDDEPDERPRSGEDSGKRPSGEDVSGS